MRDTHQPSTRPGVLLLLGLLAGCAASLSAEDPDTGPEADAVVGQVGRDGGAGDATGDAGLPPDARTPSPDGGPRDRGLFDRGPPDPDAAPPPDDPCQGQPDGAHCGTDLGAGADHGARYECVAGRTATTTVCPSGCAEGVCTAPPPDPCEGAANGTHCGGTLSGGREDHLYTCQDARTALDTPCAQGCLVRPPGSPDVCRPDNDPCARAASDGAWCGGSLGADTETLYLCRAGTTAEARPCANGCSVMPAGVDDTCRDGDPCRAADAGNGAYCGRTLGAGEPDLLYTCRDGATAASQRCDAGCQPNPPGVPDACAAAGDPCARANAGNGAYCGRTLGVGQPDTLYACRNGTTTSAQACAGGCQEMPAGVDDACRALADPCQAAAVNGLYCGSSLGAGDADTLYTCRDARVAAATPCAAGCQANPPGVPDQCRRAAGMCCLDAPAGHLTQPFTACGGGGEHYGMDYGTAIGTPIHAGMAGTIQSSRLGLPNCWNNGCSPACWNAFNYVRLVADCGDPNDANRDLVIWYLHIDALAPGIADGVHVEQGQLLAYSGNSGCSSGPHIHLETASVPRGQGVNLNTCASVNPAGRYCR